MASIYGIHFDKAPPAINIQNLTVTFGSRTVLSGVTLAIPARQVVALVGPSGCGKSTLLKSLNRMNEMDPEAEVKGEVSLFGQDIYHPEVDPAAIRQRVGMVFQAPNPFPNSIFENIAFGPRVTGQTRDVSRIVEDSLRRVGLWDEVSDRLTESALNLSGGQQQRLCIARALAVGPEVLLMDEPASELDPRASQRIEELIGYLKEEYTIVLVTHNLQQAARISDYTAFLEAGKVVEYGPTKTVFTNPRDERTEAFLTGRFR
jgi:phosphate transport system ATP-binding protein